MAAPGPPETAGDSHRLARAALEATQDPYIALEDYFKLAVSAGIADDTTAQTGRRWRA